MLCSNNHIPSGKIALSTRFKIERRRWSQIWILKLSNVDLHYSNGIDLTSSVLIFAHSWHDEHYWNVYSHWLVVILGMTVLRIITYLFCSWLLLYNLLPPCLLSYTYSRSMTARMVAPSTSRGHFAQIQTVESEGRWPLLNVGSLNVGVYGHRFIGES